MQQDFNPSWCSLLLMVLFVNVVPTAFRSLTSSSCVDNQDPTDPPDQVTPLKDSGGWGRRCRGRRGQGAGDYGFNLRHMKHWVNLEGRGKQEMESRRVNDLLHHVQPHVARGQFAGEDG